ncbi:MAG: 16S rRNA (cytidine(1402)-2'-O)-methyltransferase [Thermoanaerobacteraceae bacterium]|nr:16S rRNA (cytidine(1402)-2'-O)-methyltransferase [Thermoanaerobacteraceae bacterium]
MKLRGKLYLCATPIGNLKDITLRALEVLREVDIIAAEDTRNTIKLLNHYDIHKKLISYHEHNEARASEEIIDMLKDGMSVAVVSDAGMPAISDPGEVIVRRCIEEAINIEVVPGPSAFTAALAMSGLDTGRFCFEGFLPRKKKERDAIFEELKGETRTIIIYESPKRVIDTLKDILNILGDRRVSVSREITKVYEETFRGSVGEAISNFEEKGTKGEFVLIIEGIKKEKPLLGIDFARGQAMKYMDQGMKKMDAIKLAAKDAGVSKREVYDLFKEV